MKKNKTAAVTKILCAILVLGATGITAYAENTTPPSSAVSSAPAPSQAAENDTEDAAKQAELAAQAKITEADAVAAAQAANPGYTFTVKELENKNGTIFYSLKGTDANGTNIKCHVNAMDGSVNTKADDQENDAEDAAKQAELAA